MTAVLAIETATPRISVAVWRDGGVVASASAADSRRHCELLAPSIQAVMAEAGLAMGDLRGVGVDVGPGLFTGLRVGVATAKALVDALGVPAVAVTSVEVLAHRHRAETRPIAAVVDARRHEVFWALYRSSASTGPVEVIAPEVVAPAELAEHLRRLGEEVLVVGEGAERYRDVLAGPGIDIPTTSDPVGGDDLLATTTYPDAGVAVGLAAVRLAAGDTFDAAGLHALYLRQADVRIGWARYDDPVVAGGAARRAGRD